MQRTQWSRRLAALLVLLALAAGAVPSAAAAETDTLEQAAARAGVHVNGLSAYYMEHPEDCPPATVVLGYSDMDERALRAAVDALRCAWGARPSE